MKRGQIWVETVIYTLIGIAIIGIVLAIAKPKIEQKKDEIAIEQAIQSLGEISNKIYAVRSAVGNRRILELKITKGELILNSTSDEITWVINSKYQYSEENETIEVGNINITTIRSGNWKVYLKLNLPIDLSVKSSTNTQKIEAAPTPYKLSIENKGLNNQGKQIIEIAVS